MTQIWADRTCRVLFLVVVLSAVVVGFRAVSRISQHINAVIGCCVVPACVVAKCGARACYPRNEQILRDSDVYAGAS